VLRGASGVFDVMCLKICLVSVQCREAVLHGRRAPDEMWGNWHFRVGVCYRSFVVLLSNLVHFGWL